MFATTLGARGTDWKFDEYLADGGLSVVLTFHPPPRVLAQVRGRAGRQGKPGKFYRLSYPGMHDEDNGSRQLSAVLPASSSGTGSSDGNGSVLDPEQDEDQDHRRSRAIFMAERGVAPGGGLGAQTIKQRLQHESDLIPVHIQRSVAGYLRTDLLLEITLPFLHAVDRFAKAQARRRKFEARRQKFVVREAASLAASVAREAAARSSAAWEAAGEAAAPFGTSQFRSTFTGVPHRQLAFSEAQHLPKNIPSIFPGSLELAVTPAMHKKLKAGVELLMATVMVERQHFELSRKLSADDAWGVAARNLGLSEDEFKGELQERVGVAHELGLVRQDAQLLLFALLAKLRNWLLYQKKILASLEGEGEGTTGGAEERPPSGRTGAEFATYWQQPANAQIIADYVKMERERTAQGRVEEVDADEVRAAEGRMEEDASAAAGTAGMRERLSSGWGIFRTSWRAVSGLLERVSSTRVSDEGNSSGADAEGKTSAGDTSLEESSPPLFSQRSITSGISEFHDLEADKLQKIPGIWCEGLARAVYDGQQFVLDTEQHTPRGRKAVRVRVDGESAREILKGGDVLRRLKKLVELVGGEATTWLQTQLFHDAEEDIKHIVECGLTHVVLDDEAPVALSELHAVPGLLKRASVGLGKLVEVSRQQLSDAGLWKGVHRITDLLQEQIPLWRAAGVSKKLGEELETLAKNDEDLQEGEEQSGARAASDDARVLQIADDKDDDKDDDKVLLRRVGMIFTQVSLCYPSSWKIF